MNQTRRSSWPGVVLVVLTALQLVSSAQAEQTTAAQLAAQGIDQKIDRSITLVAEFVDDNTLTAQVKGALLQDETIDGNDISVVTEGGVVLLRGVVSHPQMVVRAAKIATQIPGVKSVNNQLQFKSDDSAQVRAQSIGEYTDDALITSAVKAKLLADSRVPSRHVKVETHDGIVLLTGQVVSQQQADRAEAIARAVSGVKRVKNILTVKP
ncbi:molecular chaperone OsmY [Dickeya lacustris]|uniref:Molecular chaperone OsmY n=1 Tax=Dickeya lacustris TaxID=2259638 RepID=A0ABY8GBS5_9GAMM|nr:molecular chaperone OsmY [Dickeya lacustris]WFN57314.1 molecular chaperone OsmY [Dickeya lacustris]